MPYDLTEAETIFARAHHQLDPTSHYTDREIAANELLDAVGHAAEDAGYQVRNPSGGARTIILQSHGAVTAVVDDDRFYLHVAGPPQTSITDLAIEYDPVTKAFVGKVEDTFVLPVPGEPRKRRNAVAVVAERIVELLDVQSKARQQVR
jgi:hypothetical protein